MHMRQHLDVRMEQKLKLTPQMIQSIEILLLSQLALEERLMNEIESNPALEMADEVDQSDRRATDVVDAAPAAGERFESAHRDDPDVWADLLKKRRQNSGGDEDAPDKMAAIEATAGPPPSLADHLLEQLRFIDMPETVRELVPDICWAIDRRGYLTEALTELFPDERLEDAESAWEYIRQVEPAGIGARDLKDCLLLQLGRESGDNSFEALLIQDHLEDVLRNRLPVVAQALGADVERVQEGVEVIAHLDPAPGAPFARSENRVVIPDVVIDRNEGSSEWEVSIPDSHMPKVIVSETYSEMVDTPGIEERERSYLKEQISSARFLLDAVAQRKRTLLKIATEIVRHQTAFLDQGLEFLRPLMRQDIADKIGMHVATVSRAVKDKYAQTPSGIIPLANFFSGGIATQDGGEAESSQVVKLKIKTLIEQEDAKKPLSDQAIADLLAKDGLDISRRTVTKYRIALNIPSTRQRRRFGE